MTNAQIEKAYVDKQWQRLKNVRNQYKSGAINRAKYDLAFKDADIIPFVPKIKTVYRSEMPEPKEILKAGRISKWSSFKMKFKFFTSWMSSLLFWWKK